MAAIKAREGKDWKAIEYASDDLKNNKEFIVEAMKVNIVVVDYAGSGLYLHLMDPDYKSRLPKN